ncbi:DUF905 family protein [Enterobacter cloacae complex sp. ECC445]|uniref:DUF905 family protein n=1 Tax=Enterobacter cloacae complex sp. ECC445 TaxID=2913213 RepID=UPI003FA4A0A9
MRPACTCPIEVPGRKLSDRCQINHESGELNERTSNERYRNFNGAGAGNCSVIPKCHHCRRPAGGHFRIVIRNIALPCSPMIWRHWNFDTDALAALELHLQADGVKACTDNDPGRTFSG